MTSVQPQANQSTRKSQRKCVGNYEQQVQGNANLASNKLVERNILDSPGFKVRKHARPRVKFNKDKENSSTQSPGSIKALQESTPTTQSSFSHEKVTGASPKRKGLSHDNLDVSPSKRSAKHRLPLSRIKCGEDRTSELDELAEPTKNSEVVLSPRKRLSDSFVEIRTPRKVTEEHDKPIASPAQCKKGSLSSPFVADAFSSVKKALNTQQPDRVVCRDEEIGVITQFLHNHIDKGKSGSLYISGAPGTGKTAVIKHVLSSKYQNGLQKVFINSMTLKSPYLMYKAIATELLGAAKAATLKSAKAASSHIQKYLTSKGQMVLLVLDEMDQLDSKNQEVLYTIFEWPSIASSRLVLIGIANALDLTDRILPRLHLRMDCIPQLLNFAPYTKEQIVSVIESRLTGTSQQEGQVLDKSAMMFCARKVSAVAGDMRKALDICRRSVELTQLASRKQALLKLKGKENAKDLANATRSPNETDTAAVATPSKVSIVQVAGVVDEVYGSASTASKNSTFPLQQKLIVCTLLLMLKNSKLKELTLGKVHDAYCRVCRKRDVTATDQSEFLSLCQLLESRGLIGMKKAKETRQTKISLKMDAKELEFALQDKLLITAVLNAGL